MPIGALQTCIPGRVKLLEISTCAAALSKTLFSLNGELGFALGRAYKRTAQNLATLIFSGWEDLFILK